MQDIAQHPKMIVFVAKKYKCDEIANQFWESVRKVPHS
jgi:hypothetical protein